jgi:hypothetical protein
MDSVDSMALLLVGALLGRFGGPAVVWIIRSIKEPLHARKQRKRAEAKFFTLRAHLLRLQWEESTSPEAWKLLKGDAKKADDDYRAWCGFVARGLYCEDIIDVILGKPAPYLWRVVAEVDRASSASLS